MKIVVDVMGFENELCEAIHACNKFLDTHTNEKIDIYLVGDKNQINPLIKVSKFFNQYKVIHTNEYIAQTDTVFSARRKSNSSMQIAAKLLVDEKLDGLLSAGNTAVFVYTMYSTIGMINGINKLGFMPTIPTINNNVVNLIDVGASITVGSEDLLNFAKMANIYAMQRTNNPRIGVLNIGTEEHKGFEIHHQIDNLLKQTKLNYIGFIEPKEILNNVVDVIVCDGYSGNLVLKSCEGSVKTFSNEIRKEYKKPQNFLAALLSKRIFGNIKKRFDYKNHAGAIVMGLNKLCIKTHGSADCKQFYSSLEMLYLCIKNNVIKQIKNEFNKYDK